MGQNGQYKCWTDFPSCDNANRFHGQDWEWPATLGIGVESGNRRYFLAANIWNQCNPELQRQVVLKNCSIPLIMASSPVIPACCRWDTPDRYVLPFWTHGGAFKTLDSYLSRHELPRMTLCIDCNTHITSVPQNVCKWSSSSKLCDHRSAISQPIGIFELMIDQVLNLIFHP